MCRVLVQNGANVLSTDKNKERPMHYAKRNNHREVYEFLSTSKNDYRKTKEMREDRRMQESSQNTNTIDRKRKKEGTKNEYSLVYVNEEGQVKVLSFQELMNFKEASE
jgi:ankyrin repeat protein